MIKLEYFFMINFIIKNIQKFKNFDLIIYIN